MFLVAVLEIVFSVSHPRHNAMGHNSVCHVFYSGEQILGDVINGIAICRVFSSTKVDTKQKKRA